MRQIPPPSAVDLAHVFHGAEPLWERLRGQHLFITGGTGFVGKWLLASLLEANQRMQLDCSVSVLSRDPRRFAAVAPFLANAQGVRLLEGDVRNFEAPVLPLTHVIHAATDVEAPGDALTTFDTCATGTRRVLDYAAKSGARKFLLISSGAVYGRQPADLAAIPETCLGAPDCLVPSSAYGEGKRVSEWLANTYSTQYGLDSVIARLFAFVGPYLPMDKHFAIGNFIRDALAGQPIDVKGDGTPYRSYLYAADMAVWLWTLLLEGKPRTAYNVGGSEAVSISELAGRVVKTLGAHSEVRIAKRPAAGTLAERYVPDTRRAETTLSLRQQIALDEAILRTADWHRRARTG